MVFLQQIYDAYRYRYVLNRSHNPTVDTYQRVMLEEYKAARERVHRLQGVLREHCYLPSELPLCSRKWDTEGAGEHSADWQAAPATPSPEQREDVLHVQFL